MAADPATFTDKITNVAGTTAQPLTLTGSVSAAATVNVYSGSTTGPLLGSVTVAAAGTWSVTDSTVSLANGAVTLVAQAVSGSTAGTAVTLPIFVDTSGPQVSKVTSNGQDVFLRTPTASTSSSALDITFTDKPARVTGFVYPAVDQLQIVQNPSNYFSLIDAQGGSIPIASVTYTDQTVVGGPGTTQVQLNFATTLPNNTYVLKISDSLQDPAGNALDGLVTTSSTGTDTIVLPSGTGTPGSGWFSASFVVQTMPAVSGFALAAGSDSGVAASPATLTDDITNVTGGAAQPLTLTGTAQETSTVNVYAVGVSGNVLLGTTTVPGTDPSQTATWTVTDSTVSLNAASISATTDGARTLIAQAVNTSGISGAQASLKIVLDTVGPRVASVTANGQDVFLRTPTASTPSTTALDITFTDSSAKAAALASFAAVNGALAQNTANYSLIGLNQGVIPISSVTYTNVPGGPGTTEVQLNFASPLPNDTYTLAISDALKNDAGTRLDGLVTTSSTGTDTIVLPSGNGTPGSGWFSASFVVQSAGHFRLRLVAYAARAQWQRFGRSVRPADVDRPHYQRRGNDGAAPDPHGHGPGNQHGQRLCRRRGRQRAAGHDDRAGLESKPERHLVAHRFNGQSQRRCGLGHNGRSADVVCASGQCLGHQRQRGVAGHFPRHGRSPSGRRDEWDQRAECPDFHGSDPVDDLSGHRLHGHRGANDGFRLPGAGRRAGPEHCQLSIGRLSRGHDPDLLRDLHRSDGSRRDRRQRAGATDLRQPLAGRHVYADRLQQLAEPGRQRAGRRLVLGDVHGAGRRGTGRADEQGDPVHRSAGASTAATTTASFPGLKASDTAFAGNFADPTTGVADGYSKLAAYGLSGGTYRFLFQSESGAVQSVVSPVQTPGLPVAGNFYGNASTGGGDGVGIFTGKQWYLFSMVVSNGQISLVKIGSPVNWPAQGLPVVGDFNGDGFADLATWSNGGFYVAYGANQYSGVTKIPLSFPGASARPVAADIDGETNSSTKDPIADLGLWVPSSPASSTTPANWYFLPSGGVPLSQQTPLSRVVYQYDSSAGVPIAGIFSAATLSGVVTSTAGTSAVSAASKAVVKPTAAVPRIASVPASSTAVASNSASAVVKPIVTTPAATAPAPQPVSTAKPSVNVNAAAAATLTTNKKSPVPAPVLINVVLGIYAR